MTTAIALPGTMSSKEFMHAVGITYRQLDHWTRNGVLTPVQGTGKGSGVYRRFNPADVPVGRVLARFSRVVDVATGAGHAAAGTGPLAILAGHLTDNLDGHRGKPLFINPDGRPHIPNQFNPGALPAQDAVFIHPDAWS